MIRVKQPDESLPWDLLLMADEEIPAIEKYIYDCVIFLALEKDSVVGECAIRNTGPGRAEIMSIAVLPEFRKKGLGKQLLRKAIQWAEDQNISSVDIGSADTSAIPLAFYRSEGFTDYEIRKNFFRENYSKPVIENGKECIDMIVLRKQIKKDPDSEPGSF